MSRLNLKHIFAKTDAIHEVIAGLCERIGTRVCIQDERGRLLYGSEAPELTCQLPIIYNDKSIGTICSSGDATPIRDLLQYLIAKEDEKKKVAAEVLHLYQEINLIFNFSEKLAQTIDAAEICQITLNEAKHIIGCDNAVIVLWNDDTRRLQVVASHGNLFFEEELINEKMSHLLRILLSGQSEIVSDTEPLVAEGIVHRDVNSILYAALKVNHRIMGAIIMATHNEDQYTAADLKLLTTLALQSSSAIESALLYEKNIRESKKREEAMRVIYEAAGKFVPYEFIGALGHKVITDVKLGDQVEKIVTVLFCDIRDYTTFSEQMTPEENFRFVSSFNERMGPPIRKNHGFINQYLGDSIMAIFPGNASDALNAAIEMQKAVNEINVEWTRHNRLPVRVGIGMHTGPLIMGITGDKERLDATTISDTVNTASRLESLTKYYKVGIILSEASVVQLTKEHYHLRYLGLVQLKGKQEPIHIHECFSADQQSDVLAKQRTLPLFTVGLEQYLNRSFAASINAFQTIKDIHPTDKTASFLLDNAREHLEKGTPDNWKGVMEMVNK